MPLRGLMSPTVRPALEARIRWPFGDHAEGCPFSAEAPSVAAVQPHDLEPGPVPRAAVRVDHPALLGDRDQTGAPAQRDRPLPTTGDHDELVTARARLGVGDQAAPADPEEIPDRVADADDALVVPAPAHDEVDEAPLALADARVRERAGRRYGRRDARAEAATQLGRRRAEVTQLKPVREPAVDHRDEPVAAPDRVARPLVGLGDRQLVDVAGIVLEVQLTGRRRAGLACDQQLPGNSQ